MTDRTPRSFPYQSYDQKNSREMSSDHVSNRNHIVELWADSRSMQISVLDMNIAWPQFY